MIKINKLNKMIGNKQILYDVNLDVKKGDIFGFLGPNKAGKTTTMKILAGILLPTSGDVFLDGKKMPDARQEVIDKVCFIPDYPLLYDKLTGREYLNFIYSIFKLEENKRSLMIDYYLRKFDLNDQANDLVEDYSLGMKQKLSFAAAFIRNPQVLLVDEPMNGLDPRASRQIQNMFVDFASAGGTILLSTHILDIAERICNKISVINHGRTVATGSMSELRTMMKIESGNLIDIFLAVTDASND
ncbi:MAG: ABC-type transporter ATP-binding protein EcsA [Elusimicrobia bacterium ADurb.Bin231]|nr:MAG: ABC-type transporter ATP-binding protein EcsA [Elusimicrobia bacterium ADurb.Bin231]